MSVARSLLVRRLSGVVLRRSVPPSYAANSAYSTKAKTKAKNEEQLADQNGEMDDIPTEGISRPLAEILKELNRKLPDSLIRTRIEDGFAIKYVPWHIMNRILNIHAPEWSSEVRNIVYSSDSKSVSVVYRVTLYGVDAEIYREATGTCNLDDTTYGDAVQKAESMAFRRACARLGLGLHLYHEEMS